MYTGKNIDKGTAANCIWVNVWVLVFLLFFHLLLIDATLGLALCLYRREFKNLQGRGTRGGLQPRIILGCHGKDYARQCAGQGYSPGKRLFETAVVWRP